MLSFARDTGSLPQIDITQEYQVLQWQAIAESVSGLEEGHLGTETAQPLHPLLPISQKHREVRSALLVVKPADARGPSVPAIAERLQDRK